jgi:hypothetical protein
MGKQPQVKVTLKLLPDGDMSVDGVRVNNARTDGHGGMQMRLENGTIITVPYKDWASVSLGNVKELETLGTV